MKYRALPQVFGLAIGLALSLDAAEPDQKSAVSAYLLEEASCHDILHSNELMALLVPSLGFFLIFIDRKKYHSN